MEGNPTSQTTNKDVPGLLQGLLLSKGTLGPQQGRQIVQGKEMLTGPDLDQRDLYTSNPKQLTKSN